MYTVVAALLSMHLYFHKFSHVLYISKLCFIEMQSNAHCNSYTKLSVDKQIYLYFVTKKRLNKLAAAPTWSIQLFIFC